MTSPRLASQISFPPDRKLSASTQTNHPPSRIFIGSLSSQLPVPSSSSHSRNPPSETDEPRQRKRDVIRRRRKKSNSVGEWGENKAGPGGVRGWVGRKVAGAGGGGESEERLVQAAAAAEGYNEEEEENVGLGWFRIRWEGESSRGSGGSRSRESSGGKVGGGELNRKRASSVGDVSAGADKKFFIELPSGLTSSPIATPNLPEPTSSSLHLAPGPSRREWSSSQPPPSSTFPPSSSSNTNGSSSSPLRPPPITQISNVSSVVDSFVTAQSFVSASSSLQPGAAPLDPHTSSTSSLPDHSSSQTITPPGPSSQPGDLPTFHHIPASPSSSLHHPAASLPPPKPSQTVPPALLRSALRRPTVEPKGQTVHFPLTPALSRIGSFGRGKGKQGVLAEEMEEPEEGLEGDGEPADPNVVLGRSEAPPLGEAGQDDDGRDFGPKDVILRDRMLVKVQYSRSAGLPSQYDEWAQRRVPADRSEAWEEKLVVLRKGAVEIWEDWNLPLREKFAGKKKLAHLIPLDVKTSLSLYSHTDLTFCLGTPSTSVSSTSSSTSKKNTTRLKTNRAGTSIFLFNPKTRTRSTDWMWEIYLLLSTSYALPRFLDVHVPDLNNARIRIPVPVVGETHGFDSTEAVVRAVSRRGVIESCVEVLKDLDGWKRLMQEMGVKDGEEGNWEEVEGKVALAWRKRDRLDWIWTDLDVNGRRRDWNLLVGAGPLNQMRIASVLELRLARHNNAVVHLKGGGRAFEPPGIEGYLTRVKPKTQTLRTTIYVTSHDGNLFVCTSGKSHPPFPPTSATSPTSPSAAETTSTPTSPAKSSVKSSKSKPSKIPTSSKAPPPPPSSLEEFRFSERCRAVLQILGSSGLVDFRSIVDVRRVSRTPRPSAPAGGHDAPENGGDENGGGPTEDDDGWESLEEDEEDEGGEEGLRMGKERGEATEVSELRRKRMFEIELITGDVQTFEAHSRLGAREWVERLNDLRIFWSAKHETTALREMEVSQAKHIHTSGIVSGRKHAHTDNDDNASDDSDEVIDPDEPPPYLEDLWNWCVIEDCRNITKAGRVFTKRGNRQYRSKYTILLSGHLLQFSLHVEKPFHLRSHRISLIDAYVYTGLLAQDELPPSSNENALRHESRRYADGLQTSDGAEDTCLVLWYRPHLITSNAAKLHERVASDETFTPPPLGKSGHEQMVLRARSKLERDSWAWCLGFEIERLTRRRVVREERMRAAGKID